MLRVRCDVLLSVRNVADVSGVSGVEDATVLIKILVGGFCKFLGRQSFRLVRHLSANVDWETGDNVFLDNIVYRRLSYSFHHEGVVGGRPTSVSGRPRDGRLCLLTTSSSM